MEIWLNSLKAAYPWTEILWEHEWINIKHKLVSLIALAFSVLFDQVGFIALSACTAVFAKFYISMLFALFYPSLLELHDCFAFYALQMWMPYHDKRYLRRSGHVFLTLALTCS